jgi:hypothetical protein
MDTPLYTLDQFVAEAMPPDGFEQWYICENQLTPLTRPVTQRWSAWWYTLNAWMRGCSHDSWLSAGGAA